MSNKLQEIYEGWKNKLTPESMLDPYIKEIAKERMAICNACEFNSNHPKATPLVGRPDHHCTDCTCNLDAKSKCLICECPLKKWLAAVKDE